MNVMRAGPQLGVAKAARAPPCTLPILGRRSILTPLNFIPFTKQKTRFTQKSDCIFTILKWRKFGAYLRMASRIQSMRRPFQ